MASDPNGDSSIVVAFDFSPTSELAYTEALSVAQRRGLSRLTVVSVGASEGDNVRLELDDRVAAMSIASARALLKMHLARIHGPEDSEIHESFEVSSGSAGEEIVRQAARRNADLIVLGTHGRHGLRRALLGSVAEHVVRNAGCTVMVVRAKAHEAASRRARQDPLLGGSALL
jgi:nucleotide-binding universal stress UspA family protein